MKKHILIAWTIAASTGFLGCQKDSSSSAQPGYPPVQDLEYSPEDSIRCVMRTINAYNRVIQDAAEFSWEGTRSSLSSLLSSCGNVRTEFRLYNTQACWAQDLATGEPILISELDVRDTCEMANIYGGVHDRNRTKTSSVSGKQRAKDFDIEKLQQKEVHILKEEDVESRRSERRSESRGGRPNPPKRTQGTPGR